MQGIVTILLYGIVLYFHGCRTMHALVVCIALHHFFRFLIPSGSGLKAQGSGLRARLGSLPGWRSGDLKGKDPELPVLTDAMSYARLM